MTTGAADVAIVGKTWVKKEESPKLPFGLVQRVVVRFFVCREVPRDVAKVSNSNILIHLPIARCEKQGGTGDKCERSGHGIQACPIQALNVESRR
jgi:hypothetical protein